MVTSSQNRLEGGARKSWYDANRLLENDKFWVSDTDVPASVAASPVRPLVQCP
jgi:hypothetical protein